MVYLSSAQLEELDLERREADREMVRAREYRALARSAKSTGDLELARAYRKEYKFYREYVRVCILIAAVTKFFELNNSYTDYEIDLHGLYVREARYIMRKGIKEQFGRYQSMRVIVGKGYNSYKNEGVLGELVEDICRECHLANHYHLRNEGLIIIEFNKSPFAAIPSWWDSESDSDTEPELESDTGSKGEGDSVKEDPEQEAGKVSEGGQTCESTIVNEPGKAETEHLECLDTRSGGEDLCSASDETSSENSVISIPEKPEMTENDVLESVRLIFELGLLI